MITAYSPLGSDNSPLLQNEVVGGLAKKYNVSPANILISLQANKINTSGKEDTITVLYLLEAEIEMFF